MSDGKWVKLEDLREPGMRRVLDALRQASAETSTQDASSFDVPDLVEEASLAAGQFARRSHGDRLER